MGIPFIIVPQRHFILSRDLAYDLKVNRTDIRANKKLSLLATTKKDSLSARPPWQVIEA